MPLIRQDLQSIDREAGRNRRLELARAEAAGKGSVEQLPEESFVAFLLEQEIQPTVGHEPRQVVRVRTS